MFEQDPRLEVVTFESAGREVTPAIDAFREAWLSSALDHDLEKHCHELRPKLRVVPKP